MQEKQETLLDTINKLKSDVDKGKEKSAQQKAHIRDLQQVWILSFISLPCLACENSRPSSLPDGVAFRKLLVVCSEESKNVWSYWL